MTLEQFVRIVLKGKDWNWLGRMTPAQLREAVGSILAMGMIDDLPPGATADTVLTQAMAGKDEPPAPALDGKAGPGIPPAAKAPAGRKQKRERVSQTKARACELVRDQLKHGPRPGAEIEAVAKAAEIPERLIAAASALGVRTQKGQWWLPADRSAVSP
jgi:hypothetical protein